MGLEGASSEGRFSAYVEGLVSVIGDADHRPVSVKELAFSLPARAWRTITWREGTNEPLRSRFARLRIRIAHRDFERSEPWPEEWLLIEWPKDEKEPTK